MRSFSSNFSAWKARQSLQVGCGRSLTNRDSDTFRPVRILITGATGFLGGRLAGRLVGDGHHVRASVRRPGDEHRTPEGVHGVVAPLNEVPALIEAVTGVDVIVHAAGGGRGRRPEDFFVNNTETTRSLLEAAVAQGDPRRFVLVSSVAAKAAQTHYGRSKRDAEGLALDAAEHMDVVVLRPPAVYGPGDERMRPLFRAAARGFVPRVARSGGRISLLHVDDCTSALVAVLEAGAGVYEADDGPAHTWEELAQLLGRALSRSRTPRLVGVPKGALFGAALATEAIGRMRNRSVLLTRDKARELTGSDPVTDSSSLRKQLGWTHTVELSEGFRQTADWYRSRGDL